MGRALGMIDLKGKYCQITRKFETNGKKNDGGEIDDYWMGQDLPPPKSRVLKDNIIPLSILSKSDEKSMKSTQTAPIFKLSTEVFLMIYEAIERASGQVHFAMTCKYFGHVANRTKPSPRYWQWRSNKTQDLNEQIAKSPEKVEIHNLDFIASFLHDIGRSLPKKDKNRWRICPHCVTFRAEKKTKWYIFAHRYDYYPIYKENRDGSCDVTDTAEERDYWSRLDNTKDLDEQIMDKENPKPGYYICEVCKPICRAVNKPSMCNGCIDMRRIAATKYLQGMLTVLPGRRVGPLNMPAGWTLKTWWEHYTAAKKDFNDRMDALRQGGSVPTEAIVQQVRAATTLRHFGGDLGNVLSFDD